MLGDEVTRNGVENAQTHKETTNEIEKGFPPKALHNEDIKRQLDQPVGELIQAHREGVNNHRPQGIEEGLEEGPDELAKLVLE